MSIFGSKKIINTSQLTLQSRGSHGRASEPLEYVPSEADDEHEVKPEEGGTSSQLESYILSIFQP